MKYVNGTKLDERIIRTDLDPGYKDGRNLGRGRSGGQVSLLFLRVPSLREGGGLVRVGMGETDSEMCLATKNNRCETSTETTMTRVVADGAPDCEKRKCENDSRGRRTRTFRMCQKAPHLRIIRAIQLVRWHFLADLVATCLPFCRSYC